MLERSLKAGTLPAIFLLNLFGNSNAAAQDALQAQSSPLPVSIYATQSRSGVSLNELGSSITIIGEDDIKNSGAVTAADALRHVPGLAVNQSGGIGSFTQIRIRGSAANHILLIVDGVRYNDPGGIGYDFSGLLASEIESIEIIRGPQSGIYGTDAHSGVIAITTKSGRGIRKPVVEVQAEGGSFGTLSSSIFTANGNENVWGSISVNGTKTNGYNVSLNGSEPDGASIGTLNLRGGINPVNGFDMDGSLRASAREADFDISNSSDPSQPPLIDSPLPHYRENDYAGQVAANYQAPGSALHQHVSWDGYSFLRKSIDNFGPFNSDGDRNEALYRANYTFNTPDLAESKHDLSLQLSHEWLDYVTSFQPEHAIETSGFAGEWRTGFYNRFFLSGAIRHDISSFFENPTTYRLTSRANFDDGISVHSAVGTGVTNPTLIELFGGGGGGFVANPSLKPESSFEWEVGITKTWTEIPVSLGLTYFNGRTTNEIRTVTMPVFTAVNDPGVSPHNGVEITASYAPTRNLNISGSYTFLNAHTAAGLEEIRRPPNAAALDVDWRFLDDKAKLKLGVAYNGTMVDSDFRTFPAPLVQLPAYTLVNGTFSYQFTEQAEAYIRVQNALDQQYQEVFGFRGQPVSAYAGVRAKLGE